MKALLDAHTLIWYAGGDRRLSPVARDWIQDAGNERVLSTVTAWEILVKALAGRLRLDTAPLAYLEHHRSALFLESLPLRLDHAYAVAGLPSTHGDPFDRMLVAQARVERLPIITGDVDIRRYGVEIIW